MSGYCHVYTEEQKQFLRDHIGGCSYKDMTAQFNKKFGLSLNVGRISAAIKRYNLTNGRDLRFKKGHSTWNKGRKGVRYSPATEFKKGNMPVNHRPVGSERVTVDGYIEIKVEEPHRWELKHRVLWKNAFGAIPPGHALVFLDNDPLHCALENLALLTRAELLIVNRHRFIKSDPELTKVGIQTAKLMAKVYELSKVNQSEKVRKT